MMAFIFRTAQPFRLSHDSLSPPTTMRSVSPHSPRNGGGDATPAATPSPAHRRHDRLSPPPPFQSTLSLQKLRRFNTLALVLRLAAFCFSLASAVFMATSSRGSASSRWYNFEAYRYVFAANAVVALYSLFELGVSVWEISRNSTLLPEILQVWFDFGHDQIFGYMQLSAGSAGTTLARMLKGSDTCAAGDAFCMPTDIAIALGFASFLFLACSCLLSSFRLACFIIKGSRFHL